MTLVHFVHSNLCTEIANSDFAHVCLGFITHKQRENASRRQRVNSNSYCSLRFRLPVLGKGQLFKYYCLVKIFHLYDNIGIRGCLIALIRTLRP